MEARVRALSALLASLALFLHFTASIDSAIDGYYIKGVCLVCIIKCRDRKRNLLRRKMICYDERFERREMSCKTPMSWRLPESG